MGTIKIFLIFCILVVLSQQDSTYKKILPNLDPQAKCLDGSPGGLYIHQGSETKKFLIYIIGGGICAGLSVSDTLENCYRRSKTMLGSSKLWPDKLDDTHGLISMDPKQSKFAQWTKVLFIYCDGAFHQGYKKDPYSYKDSKLYFRGSLIMRQHFQWLDAQYGLYSAQKVVFSGISAGGFAVFLWSNYLMQKLKTPTVLSNIIDSANFVNSTTYPDNRHLLDIQGQNLIKVANVDQKVPLKLCALKYPNDLYKCFYLGLVFAEIEARTLIIDSQYDSQELTNTMQMKCVKETDNGFSLIGCNEKQLQHIKSNTQLRRKVVQNMLLFTRFSAWSIACSAHGYTPWAPFYEGKNQRIPMNSQHSVRDAVERFVFSEQRITEVDGKDWPNNKPCAN